MAEDLRDDSNGHRLQCFVPNKFVEITAASEWTPEGDDLVFSVPEDCTYIMTGETVNASLIGGALRAIKKGAKYTFDTTMVIEVM